MYAKYNLYLLIYSLAKYTSYHALFSLSLHRTINIYKRKAQILAGTLQIWADPPGLVTQSKSKQILAAFYHWILKVFLLQLLNQ